MIAHPVWSTWAKFKMAVNQTLVLSYAHDIVDHGFNCSQVEIDDRWSPYYGALRGRVDACAARNRGGHR